MGLSRPRQVLLYLQSTCFRWARNRPACLPTDSKQARSKSTCRLISNFSVIFASRNFFTVLRHNCFFSRLHSASNRNINRLRSTRMRCSERAIRPRAIYFECVSAFSGHFVSFRERRLWNMNKLFEAIRGRARPFEVGVCYPLLSKWIQLSRRS